MTSFATSADRVSSTLAATSGQKSLNDAKYVSRMIEPWMQGIRSPRVMRVNGSVCSAQTARSRRAAFGGVPMSWGSFTLGDVQKAIERATTFLSRDYPERNAFP